MTGILVSQNIKVHFPVHSGWLERIIGVRKGIPDSIKAVDDITFNVEEGEILGFIGESGSGKTTLARTLIRLIPATSGSAIFHGENIFTMSAAEIRQKIRPRIRMIFQHPAAALNPAYTVDKILAQAIKQNDNTTFQTKTRIDELLLSVGLNREYALKYPHELSGGEKRRIGICRALATMPEVIIADEPLSGLDVSLQTHILDLLLKIKDQRSLTILFISHDIGLVTSICDRMAVIYKGRLVEIGAKVQVSPTHCRHPYTRQLFTSQVTNILQRKKKVTKGTSGIYLRIPEDISPSEGCPYLNSCKLWREQSKPANCKNDKPLIREITPGHFTACHLVE